MIRLSFTWLYLRTALCIRAHQFPLVTSTVTAFKRNIWDIPSLLSSELNKTITQLQVNEWAWKQTMLRESWMLKHSGARADARAALYPSKSLYFYLRFMSGAFGRGQTNSADDTRRAFLSIRRNGDWFRIMEMVFMQCL